MKAIIMAGGEGSRLRPLTCDCPKPMMRLMNRPIMQYALELLKKHGITQIAATLGYLPDSIPDEFGDGSDQGLNLKWYVEPEPLGTAGGVKQAADFLDETFVVLSGDGVTDLDLGEVVRFHRSRNALATIILKHESDPSEYGVVSIAEDGHIRKFYEKPGRCDMVSDLINTGIYILEPEILRHIPSGQPYDFGHDLFPKLLSENLPVFGCVMDGYWCDIGDVSAYLSAHQDALDGRIHLPEAFPRPSGITVLPGAQVDRTAILESPCLIAPGAKIASGARIGAYTVIGENCIVGERASLKRCVLWPGAQVRSGAQARGCILGTNSILDSGAQAYEGSILGSGAVTGVRAQILPGVRVWPGKYTSDGERLDANLVWGNVRTEGFAAGSIVLSSPAHAARTAQACAAVIRPAELLLGRGPSAVDAAFWHAVAAGAMSQGIQVVDAGICTLPQLRHGQSVLHTDAAALVTDRTLIPLNSLGARIPNSLQRSVNAMNTRQDFSGPFSGLTRPIRTAGLTDMAYVADAASFFRSTPSDAPTVALHAQPPHLLFLAEQTFARAGISARTGWEDSMMELAPDELGVWLDPDGERCILADENGSLCDVQQQLLIAWTALECGEHELILPVSATRAISPLAERFGAQTCYVSGEPSVWMNLLAERSPLQFRLHFDGITLALSALSLLTERGLTLDTWRRSMPSIHRRSRVVEVPASRTGSILRDFAEHEKDAELGGGVRFFREDGWAWICPDEKKPEFRIVTESLSAETAKELCDFCEKKLKQLR